MRSERMARLVTRWLDDNHLDPLIGLLLPGLGDLTSTLAGMSVIIVAWRDGVALPVLARMLLNLAIDGVVGAVPIAGDLFDFAFKAHRKNAALLEARQTRAATAGDYAILLLAALGVLAALALPIVGLVWLISAAWGSR